MKRFQITGQYEEQYFSTPALRQEEGRLHPIFSFVLMFLANNGALLVFMYMMFDGFSLVGTLALALLLLSSVMLYTTS